MPEKQSLEPQAEAEQEVKPLSDLGDIENNPSFRFIPKGHHEWRQEGYYLICRSCELEHAIWIGKDSLLVGIREDGLPLIKKRKELGFV